METRISRLGYTMMCMCIYNARRGVQRNNADNTSQQSAVGEMAGAKDLEH